MKEMLLHLKHNQGITPLKASDAKSDIQQLSKAQCTTHNKSPVARMITHQTCRGNHINQEVHAMEQGILLLYTYNIIW